jgi:hypothetical protein
MGIASQAQDIFENWLEEHGRHFEPSHPIYFDFEWDDYDPRVREPRVTVYNQSMTPDNADDIRRHVSKALRDEGFEFDKLHVRSSDRKIILPKPGDERY